MTLTELEHDDDLDRRLRCAMEQIGQRYRPHDRADDAPPRGARTGSRWVAAAAGLTLVAGALGVWAATQRSAAPPAAHPTSVPEAPAFSASFTIPDVQVPEYGVRLDRSLLDHDLPMQNPYANWLYSNEPRASRWFVSADGNQALGWIAYSDEPLAGWDEFDELPSWEEATDPDVDMRLAANGAVVWRHGDVMRTVVVTGATVGLPTAVKAATYVDDIATLEPPPGYTELTIDGYDSWQSGDWQLGTVVPPPDQFELYLSTWAVSDGVEVPITDGFLVPPFADHDDYTVVVGVDDRIVVAHAPATTSRGSLDQLAAAVEIVPAADLETTPLFELDGIEPIERQAPLAGGEIAWGRWLAVDSSRPSDVANGRHCVTFLGSVEQLGGCTDPDSVDLTVCGRVPAGTGYRHVLVTTTPLDAATVSAEVDGEPAAVTVEQSGGLAFVLADSSAEQVVFEIAGRPACGQ